MDFSISDEFQFMFVFRNDIYPQLLTEQVAILTANAVENYWLRLIKDNVTGNKTTLDDNANGDYKTVVPISTSIMDKYIYNGQVKRILFCKTQQDLEYLHVFLSQKEHGCEYLALNLKDRVTNVGLWVHPIDTYLVEKYINKFNLFYPNTICDNDN